MTNALRSIRTPLIWTIIVAGLAAIGLATAAPLSAHGLNVDPPGQETIDHGAVSTGWAQAHCNAQSPAVLEDRGAATFSPAKALPCPDEANPGGQVHPHAGSD